MSERDREVEVAKRRCSWRSWDGTVPGLCLDVHQGQSVWRFYYRPHGLYLSGRLASQAEMSVEQARAGGKKRLLLIETLPARQGLWEKRLPPDVARRVQAELQSTVFTGAAVPAEVPSSASLSEVSLSEVSLSEAAPKETEPSPEIPAGDLFRDKLSGSAGLECSSDEVSGSEPAGQPPSMCHGAVPESTGVFQESFHLPSATPSRTSALSSDADAFRDLAQTCHRINQQLSGLIDLWQKQAEKEMSPVGEQYKNKLWDLIWKEFDHPVDLTDY